MVVKIAIVDNESTAASLLEGCLHQYAEETGTAMQWEQFPDAEAFLKSDTHAFDIVFMDIDMPGRNGIEASRALRESNQSIVLLFVTNLAQYAIAGYEVDALDYILKPINYFSFKLKIQKALETVRRVQGTLLTIASDHGQQLVRDSEILYIEVQGHNLIYHTLHGDLTATGTLKQIEAQLKPSGFYRCNYCYLAKVQLAAGESKRVTVALDDKAFRYWNTLTNAWEVEGGNYEVRVGASCEDIRLTAVVTVAGTGAPNPYEGKSLPHYTSGKVQNVPDAEWETLLGRPIPDDTVKIDRNMTLGELNHSRSPLCWLIWLVLHTLLTASYKKGQPNLNVMFQYNMPLRALAKMTSGAISMGMVDGIVLEAKGFWFIGLIKVILEAIKNIILNAQLESRLRNS